jgi:hypothetical protein
MLLAGKFDLTVRVSLGGPGLVGSFGTAGLAVRGYLLRQIKNCECCGELRLLWPSPLPPASDVAQSILDLWR